MTNTTSPPAMLLPLPPLYYEITLAIFWYMYCAKYMVGWMQLTCALDIRSRQLDLEASKSPSKLIGRRLKEIDAPAGICAVCRETYVAPIELTCIHTFYDTCARQTLAHRDECPVCNREALDWHQVGPASPTLAEILEFYSAEQKSRAGVGLSYFVIAYLCFESELSITIFCGFGFLLCQSIGSQHAIWALTGKPMLRNKESVDEFEGYRKLHRLIHYLGLAWCAQLYYTRRH